jgi:hypothetical protein
VPLLSFSDMGLHRTVLAAYGLLAVFNLVNCDISNSTAAGNGREGKVFSLFSIVKFGNDVCQSSSSITNSGTTSSYRNGTCLTASECSAQSGSASGSCASGFGVCCLFATSTCSDTISTNSTYIRNPSFPSVYTSTSSCSFSITKCGTGICSLRLDFETFTILGPSSSTEAASGGACANDALAITGLSSGTLGIPTICGKNTGQHMYIDIGADEGDQATLAFTFTTSSTVRTWEIKVSQIPCGAVYAAPNGCLQYHTGTDGRLTTFNFLDTLTSHLASQNYNICIRQEDGYCCIEYSVCSDTYSFGVDHYSTIASIEQSGTGSRCTEDFVTIVGGSGTCGGTALMDRFCGDELAAHTSVSVDQPVYDCTAPFQVGFTTDTNGSPGTKSNNQRGFCLNYRQIGCGGC